MGFNVENKKKKKSGIRLVQKYTSTWYLVRSVWHTPTETEIAKSNEQSATIDAAHGTAKLGGGFHLEEKLCYTVPA